MNSKLWDNSSENNRKQNYEIHILFGTSFFDQYSVEIPLLYRF